VRAIKIKQAQGETMIENEYCGQVRSWPLQAEGCDPLNRPKDRQARFTQAIGASIV
jgi:hypothetical protein